VPEYLFNVPRPAIPVVGQAGFFPVRRIWCVGSNYRKPGKDYSRREEPYFFSKQPDMSVAPDHAISHPCGGELRFEAELVVAIGAQGRNVSEADADALVFGHAVGLDMTRRDLLLTAQGAGKPWEIGKSFDGAAPVGAITPARRALRHAAIRARQNDALRQDSDIDQMIWTVPEIIAHLSMLVTLAPGDLVFTGTPSGHGPCLPGDRIAADIAGLTPIAVQIG
jgi:fumarylpyruvate hydrolase